MAYFLSLVRQNVMVVDAKKVLVPATHLALGESLEPMPWQRRPSSLAYLIGVQGIPSGFVPRIASEVAMLQNNANCWFKD
jgi:hypothetical protein